MQRVLKLSCTFLIGAVCTVVFAGCGSLFSMTKDDIARGYLPDTRHIHHPDSLVHVATTVEDDSTDITLDRPLIELMQKWSTAPNFRHRSPRFADVSFATFVSRELALARTASVFGTGDLTDALASTIFEQAEAEYRNYIVMDLHLFSEDMMDTNPEYSNVDFYLRIDDEHTVPLADLVAQRPPKRSTIGTLYHMRSSLLFPRHDEEGNDLLEGAHSVELHATFLSQRGARTFFNWHFQDTWSALH